MGNVISLSGGKDSTAMLLKMIELGEPIDAAIFFDGGWEFPQMLHHIEQLKRDTGIEITTVYPRESFDYWMRRRPPETSEGKQLYCWPSPFRRWCNREKVAAIHRVIDPLLQAGSFNCIGFAADETARQFSQNITIRRIKGEKIRFPLMEWGMTEKDCLEYCYAKGYHWGGLYQHFRRVSCYCCPMQPIGGISNLRKYYHELWAIMLQKDAEFEALGFKTEFTKTDSIKQLDERFRLEDEAEASQIKFLPDDPIGEYPECTETFCRD